MAGIDSSNREVEQSEKMKPEIFLDFYFSSHGTPEDFKRLAELLSKTDIYVPEIVNWDQPYLDHMNNISQGRTRPKYLDSRIEDIPTAADYEQVLLYNSKKPVICINIPRDSPKAETAMEMEREADSEMEWAKDEFTQGYLGNAIPYYKLGVQKSLEYIKLRDEYMATELKENLDDIIAKFPHLKDKKEIHVLVQLGASHTSVLHKLRKEFRTKIYLNEPVFVFPIGEEASRTLQFKGDVSPDLTAKAVLEDAILSFFKKNFKQIKEGTVRNKILREISKNLSFDQIQEISRALAAGSDDQEKTKILKTTIAEMTGIVLPETSEEVKALLIRFGIQNDHKQ